MQSTRFEVTQSQRTAIGVAIVVALIGGALFLKPYFSLIVVSIILAFLFHPIYQRLLLRSGKPGRAATLTFLFASFAIIIPVSLIIYFSVRQVNSLVSNADFEAIDQALRSFLDTFNKFFVNQNINIDPSQISSAIQDGLKAAGQSIVSSIPSLFSGFFAFLTSFIIFIYVFLSLLKNNDKITTLIHVLNPLGKDISQMYVEKISAMTKATVRGQFIIAFCQGLESAMILSVAGLSDLFFFFLVLLTAVSVIPMGAGIITIPIGILLILTGDVWQGVLIIANHLIIVTNIDNVLRPRLVPKEARLDAALMILAVFCGIAYFGFLGIVLGPVIMIVIVTTIDVYLEVYRDINMKKYDKETGNKKSLYQRVGSSARGLFGRNKK